MMAPKFNALPAQAKRFAVCVAIATSGVGAWFGWHSSRAMATPPPAAPTAQAAPAGGSGGAAATVMPTTATIVFSTVPPSHATVMWGKTLLGRIAPRNPLVVVRPRDSGPLDVTVRAAGYLPVHTRAHTFSDAKIAVKLTTPEQKNTLFGYRAPLDAGVLDESLAPLGSGGSGALELQQPPQ